MSWGALLVVLYAAASCVGTALNGIRPPFWALLGMAEVGVYMEFHDLGFALPRELADGMPGSRFVPCFRDGAPATDLPGDRGCHPGLFPAEGSHAHTDPLIWWSNARVTGLAMPVFMLDSGFIARRLIPYIEEPCRAVRDFDAIIMPHLRRQAEAQQVGRSVSEHLVRGWIGGQMAEIGRDFDCEGDGRARPGQREAWEATTFRMHLYDARGEAVTTLEVVPNWTRQRGDWVPARWRNGADMMRWLPSQFPQADRTPASAP